MPALGWQFAEPCTYENGYWGGLRRGGLVGCGGGGGLHRAAVVAVGCGRGRDRGRLCDLDAVQVARDAHQGSGDPAVLAVEVELHPVAGVVAPDDRRTTGRRSAGQSPDKRFQGHSRTLTFCVR